MIHCPCGVDNPLKKLSKTAGDRPLMQIDVSRSAGNTTDHNVRFTTTQGDANVRGNLRLWAWMRGNSTSSIGRTFKGEILVCHVNEKPS